MHDNILAVIAALKVIMSVSSSIGSNVSQLFCYSDSHNSKIVLYWYGQVIRNHLRLNTVKNNASLMATADLLVAIFVGQSNCCSQTEFKSMK